MPVERFAAPDRSRSRRGVAVVASVTLLVGIALHAAIADHGSSDTHDRPSATGSPVATAPATAAVGVPPGPGPSRVEHGVPAGFAQTRDGAVVAAASYVTTGQALLDMDPLAAEDAIRQMATTATADQQASDMLAKLRAARDALADGTGRIVYRQAAIAWRVESFNAERASVAIWNVGVLTRAGVAPPQAGWATSRFELVWERGDWKVDRETITPGPAPILDNSAAPATAAQLTASLDGFTDFGSHQ
jgi:hypothetical protein